MVGSTRDVAIQCGRCGRWLDPSHFAGPGHYCYTCESEISRGRQQTSNLAPGPSPDQNGDSAPRSARPRQPIKITPGTGMLFLGVASGVVVALAQLSPSASTPGSLLALLFSGGFMALGALLLKREQKAREALKPTAKTTLPTSPPAIKTPVLDPQSELAETHKNIQAMLGMAALADYPLALENLRHWADGSGTSKTMAAEPFKSAAFLQSHLQTVHRNRFVEGVLKRLSAREATVPST